MEKVTLLHAIQQEQERRRNYNQTGNPYQPRVYYLNDKNVYYPEKKTMSGIRGCRVYQMDHWMLGNIIINKGFAIPKSTRGYAVWYSIDGKTSHKLTKENYTAISGNFACYEILPPSNELEPEENQSYFLYSLRHLAKKDSPTLIRIARNALSILCRRSREYNEELSYSQTEDIRFFLERSFVRLIKSPKEIGDLMEYIIKEHENVVDCGFYGGPHTNVKTSRLFSIRD